MLFTGKLGIFLIYICLFFQGITAFNMCYGQDRFTGKLAAVWEESERLETVNNFLILERQGGLRSRLIMENPEHFNSLINKQVTVEGRLNGQGDIEAARIVEISSEGRERQVRASSSSLKLLVAIADLTGISSVPAEITADYVRERLFTDATRSTKVLFDVNTYGAITIESVTVAARMSLAISGPPGGNCYPWYTGSMIPAVRAAFSGQGIDESTFDRVLIILPEPVGAACGFAGLAISSRETLYSGGISPSLAAHELGHNFGFGHASTDTNNDGTFDDAYGDPSCIMSIFGGNYNLMHTVKRDWFLAAGGTILPYSGSGIHEVRMSPAELAPLSAPHIQLAEITPLGGGGGRPYYVTFRKNSGTLDPLYNLDAFTNNKLYVLRPPGTLTLNTLLVAEIEPGGSFYSAADQLLIEYVSELGAAADVRFVLGPVDSDNDGMLNEADPDDDNDGILDAEDCAPTNNTRWTRRAYADQDNDGFRTNTILYNIIACVGNAPNTGFTLNESPVDNCYEVSNPDQADADGDRIGDACDTTNGSGTPGGTNPPPVITPPPGASYDTLYSFTIASLQKSANKLKAGMFTYGGADVPIVTCSVKAPNKRKFAAAKAASLQSSFGYARAFQCSGKLGIKGTYKLKIKACDRSNRNVCFGGSVNIKKR